MAKVVNLGKILNESKGYGKVIALNDLKAFSEMHSEKKPYNTEEKKLINDFIKSFESEYLSVYKDEMNGTNKKMDKKI